MPGLHGHHIRQRHAKFEYLLARNDTLLSWDRSRKAVQQGGLARLRAAGHDHVQPTDDGGFEEACGLSCEGSQANKLIEGVRGENELSDVDGPVLAGDIWDDDV